MTAAINTEPHTSYVVIRVSSSLPGEGCNSGAEDALLVKMNKQQSDDLTDVSHEYVVPFFSQEEHDTLIDQNANRLFSFPHPEENDGNGDTAMMASVFESTLHSNRPEILREDSAHKYKVMTIKELIPLMATASQSTTSSSSSSSSSNNNGNSAGTLNKIKNRCKTTAPNQAKADGFYTLLKSLVKKGVPIHGAGMQAHFNAGGVGRQRTPTPSMVKRQIRRIGALGLQVNLSEMDVRVSKLEGVAITPQHRKMFADPTRMVRDLAQTEIYQGILTAALSEPAFHGIWLWGFTDRHTWVKNFYYDDAPLIFGQNYERKASYNGVEAALRTLCTGLRRAGSPYKYLEADYDEKGKEWGSDWMVKEPVEGEEEGAGKDTTKEGQPDWVQATT